MPVNVNLTEVYSIKKRAIYIFEMYVLCNKIEYEIWEWSQLLLTNNSYV